MYRLRETRTGTHAADSLCVQAVVGVSRCGKVASHLFLPYRPRCPWSSPRSRPRPPTQARLRRTCPSTPAAQSEGAQGQARQGTGTRRQTEAGTRREQQASFYSRGVWVWVLTHLVGAVFRALSSQGGRRGTPTVRDAELPTAVSSALSCASRRADEQMTHECCLSGGILQR